MPITGNGWELLIRRQSVQQGSQKARTVGSYQVFHDGNAVAALAGTTAESKGPSSNSTKGVRINPGSYRIGTQEGSHYSTLNYNPSPDLRLSPKPGIEVLDTGTRFEILIHPGKDAFLSSIGCINLCTRLPDAGERIDYPGSRMRVMALIDDLRSFLGNSFPRNGEWPIPNAHLIIEEAARLP